MNGPHLQDLRSMLVPKCVVTSTNKPTWPHRLFSTYQIPISPIASM